MRLRSLPGLIWCQGFKTHLKNPIVTLASQGGPDDLTELVLNN